MTIKTTPTEEGNSMLPLDKPLIITITLLLQVEWQLEFQMLTGIFANVLLLKNDLSFVCVCLI